MTAYYNEIDPYCVQWLRNLITAGHIAPGVVDERDIRDIRPVELAGYEQCHFFAGIGGWSYALRLAGWPDNREVWTGSCPCQPFSAASKRGGFADERHLWPFWHYLIAQRRPPKIYGEQVSTAKLWLDGVYADLEGEDFTVRSADLPAVSVGAKHLRYRTWFAANSECSELRHQSRRSGRPDRKGTPTAAINGASRVMADASGVGQREQTNANHAFPSQGGARPVTCSDGEPLAYPDRQSAVGVTIPRCERDPWSLEPNVGRVVDGIPHKLAEPALRAFGNAIVPQVAAEFIKATL